MSEPRSILLTVAHAAIAAALPVATLEDGYTFDVVNFHAEVESLITKLQAENHTLRTKSTRVKTVTRDANGQIATITECDA